MAIARDNEMTNCNNVDWNVLHMHNSSQFYAYSLDIQTLFAKIHNFILLLTISKSIGTLNLFVSIKDTILNRMLIYPFGNNIIVTGNLFEI